MTNRKSTLRYPYSALKFRAARSAAAASPSAFTLIELLVVIAIIAILAAILFPVFARARAQARQTVCVSDMKQYGIGINMYAQDYDETLPGNSNAQVGRLGGAYNVSLGFMQPYQAGNTNLESIVPRDIQPYVKNLGIFVCPESQPRAVDGKADPVSTPGGGNTSYLLNGVVLFRPLSDIKTPSDTIFAHEETIYQRQVQSAPQCVNSNDPFCASRTYTSLDYPDRDNMHKNGGILIFCDGHAKWFYKTQILYSMFGVVPDTPTRAMSLDYNTALSQSTKVYNGAF